MSCCMRQGCVDNEHLLYDTPEAAKYARMKDKQITRILKDYHREDLRKLKILLLGKISHNDVIVAFLFDVGVKIIIKNDPLHPLGRKAPLLSCIKSTSMVLGKTCFTKLSVVIFSQYTCKVRYP